MPKKSYLCAAQQQTSQHRRHHDLIDERGTKGMKLILVAGARPNFMKIAPLVKAIKRQNEKLVLAYSRIEFILVHTGQHYDIEMSEVFFRDLGLPKPDSIGGRLPRPSDRKNHTGFEGLPCGKA
jgi:hypothetical protein